MDNRDLLICDSKSLGHLIEAGADDHLHYRYGSLVVTPAVIEELKSSKSFELRSWVALQQMHVKVIAPSYENCTEAAVQNAGATRKGEIETLALASEMKVERVLIDSDHALNNLKNDGFLMADARAISAETFMAVLYHEAPDPDWDKTEYGKEMMPYPYGFPINPEFTLREPLSEFRATVFQEGYFETKEHRKRAGEEQNYLTKQSKSLMVSMNAALDKRKAELQQEMEQNR